MNRMKMTITIINREDEEKFVNFYQDHKIPMVLTFLGNGTVSDKIRDYLGLEESEKSVLLFVSRTEKAIKALDRLKRTKYLDIPGNGISLNIPIDSIGGRTIYAMTYEGLEGENNKNMNEQSNKYKQDVLYNLIIVIANQGHCDMIMEAAKQGGAEGGTVVHAKGTGSEHVEKFFGISIAEEKEMFFIVCPTDRKNLIMKSILKNAGLHTQAKALVFSVPVDGVAGYSSIS